jgi:hypothetical protein
MLRLVNHPYIEHFNYDEQPDSERGAGGVTKVPAASPYREHLNRKRSKKRTDETFGGQKNSRIGIIRHGNVL